MMRMLRILVLIVAVSVVGGVAQGADWGDWSNLSNGRSQAVDVRYKHGNAKFEKGQQELFWQFRNRSPYPVKIEAEITYEWAGGQNKETVQVILGPDQLSNADGTYVIGKKIIGARILKLEKTN